MAHQSREPGMKEYVIVHDDEDDAEKQVWRQAAARRDSSLRRPHG